MSQSLQTLALTRFLAIVVFVAGGLLAFWIKEPGAGYMLIGAAAAAFPSGVHIRPEQRSAFGIPEPKDPHP